MGWGGFAYPWGGDIGQPFAFQTAERSLIEQLIYDPYPRFIFVLEGKPYRQGPVSADWPDAWGAFVWGYGGATVGQTIYYGSEGLVTTTTDTPASQYIPGLLVRPINWELSIPISASGEQAVGGYGTVDFVSHIDDDLISAWSGRLFTMKLGGTFGVGADTTTLDYDSYMGYWRFRAVGLEYREDTASLLVRDVLDELDAPLQRNKYTGSGTFEGGEDLVGQWKPVVYGNPFNIPAVLIDNVNYVYQLHDGALAVIEVVRDNGKALTDAGDTNSLLTWTGGSAGQYKTDESRGLIRLWAQPNGEVTCDCRRTKTAASDVIIDMLEDMGVSNIDEGSFSSLGTYLEFDTTQESEVGFYAGTDAVNALGTIQGMLTGLDAWLYITRGGVVSCGQHPNILEDMPTATIEGRVEASSPNVVVSITRITAPSPPKTVRTTYKRNYSPLTIQSLDATITEAEKRNVVWQNLFTSPAGNYGALTQSPDAKDVIIETPLRFRGDAVQLRDKITSMLGVKRDLYEITIVSPQFQLLPGQLVKIFHDRFGLQDGRIGEIISLVESADSTTIKVLMTQ